MKYLISSIVAIVVAFLLVASSMSAYANPKVIINEQQVREFQQKYGLIVDGKVGLMTLSAMHKHGYIYFQIKSTKVPSKKSKK